MRMNEDSLTAECWDSDRDLFKDTNMNKLPSAGAYRGKNWLIKVGFEIFDPDFKEYYSIGDDGHTSELKLEINKIKCTFFMQVLNRNLNFLTDHLLPAIPSNASPAPGQTPDIHNENKNPGLLLSEAFKAIKCIDWTRIEVDIKNPEIDIKEHPESTHFLKIFLGEIYIKSDRKNAFSRLKESNNFRPQKHGLSPGDCLWVDTYQIKFRKLKVQLLRKHEGTLWTKDLINPFDFIVQYETFLFEDQLKCLFTEKCVQEAIDTQPRVYMSVLPIVMIFGNLEYNNIMKALKYNIGYDDKKDHLFVMTFPRERVSKKERLRKIFEETTPSIYISIHMTNLGVVLMENSPSDGNPEAKNWTRTEDLSGTHELAEHRQVYSTIAIRDTRVIVDFIGVRIKEPSAEPRKTLELIFNSRRLNANFVAPCEMHPKHEFIIYGLIGDLRRRIPYNLKDLNELRKVIIQIMTRVKDYDIYDTIGFNDTADWEVTKDDAVDL